MRVPAAITLFGGVRVSASAATNTRELNREWISRRREFEVNLKTTLINNDFLILAYRQVAIRRVYCDTLLMLLALRANYKIAHDKAVLL